jgi:RNA polymerase sigma-70 factor, ECF subfamily
MSESVATLQELEPTEVFNAHRDLLLGVAYRLLGQLTEAEDVVQEAWLRWRRTNHAAVNDARAFLVRVTTRLALDRLRRLKARRESYVGPWLPEPLRTSPDPADRVELAESVSMALLVVLETLSPLERAVFVLREAFAFSYAEIATMLGRSEPAVRQLARRAREHVDARRPRFDADQAMRRRVTERFLRASTSGDLDALMGVLAPGVTLVADGGGVVRAALRPIVGADKVARFLAAVPKKLPADLRAQVVELNGGPGVVFTAAGAPIGAVLLDVADGRVQTLYVMANPEKLAGVRDLPAS